MESVSIVFTEKQKVEVIVREFDASLAPTEVLCGSIYSLISTGTELQCLRGIFDPDTNWAGWVQYPFDPGYSMVAEILDVGSDVRGLKKGDRVYASKSHTQYFKTDAKHVYLLPQGITDEQGTWLSLAITTQLGSRRAELALGESVGIVGLGLLGQMVAQYMYLSGARNIYAIDPAAGRLELLPKLPGIVPLAMDGKAAKEEIRALTGGAMLDVVFDITGYPAVLAQATQLVKRFGRVILLGDTSTPSKQEMGSNVVSNAVSIQGIHSIMDYKTWDHPAMSALFFDYVVQKRMNVDALITHRHSPLDAVAVYDSLTANRTAAMGVLFDWSKLKA